MSVLKQSDIFERIINIKYDIPNDKLNLFNIYYDAVNEFYDDVLKRNA